MILDTVLHHKRLCNAVGKFVIKFSIIIIGKYEKIWGFMYEVLLTNCSLLGLLDSGMYYIFVS